MITYEKVPILLGCFVVVQQKHTGGGKIDKIILLFNCILVFFLAFDENNRGVYKKLKLWSNMMIEV